MRFNKKLFIRKNQMTEAFNVGDHKLYKRRWLILTVFVCFAFGVSSHCFEFSVVNDSVAKYYAVSSYAVDWTSESYMLAYAVLFIPALWALNTLGIRPVLIGTSGGICLGSWIKWLAVSPELFYLLLIGQFLIAACAVVMFGTAARLTALWFGADEISLAGSLALFGDMSGAGMSFIFPTLIVQESDDVQLIGVQLTNLNLITAIIASCIFIMVLFTQSEPPKPPSNAQVLQKEALEATTASNFLISMKAAVSKFSFLLLLVSYGLCIGAYGAYATILSQVLHPYFPGHIEYAGNIGLITTASGIFGSLISGYFLDRTRLFKEVTVFLSFCTFACMLLFTFCLQLRNILLIYLIACGLGFFQLSYYTCGLQMGIELTYPISEEVTAGIMFLFLQSNAFLLTSAYGYFVRNIGILPANIFLSGLLLLSSVLSMLIPPHMMRQQAENASATDRNLNSNSNPPINNNNQITTIKNETRNIFTVTNQNVAALFILNDTTTVDKY